MNLINRISLLLEIYNEGKTQDCMEEIDFDVYSDNDLSVFDLEYLKGCGLIAINQDEDKYIESIDLTRLGVDVAENVIDILNTSGGKQQ